LVSGALQNLTAVRIVKLYLPVGAAGAGTRSAGETRTGPVASPFAGFSILLRELDFSLYSKFLLLA